MIMKQVLIILLIQFSLSTTLQAQTRIDTSVRDTQKIIEEIITKNNIPGMSVTISVADSIILSKGFGYANLEKDIKVEPEQTKFRVGSISKPFTSIALGYLLEHNMINLDAPVQEYVPTFPLKQYPVTIKQLGGHLSGIRNYRNNEFYNNRKYPNLHEALVIFKNDSLLFKPDTEFNYSNYGWNLISVAIENISSSTSAAFMDSIVFNPLNMNSTVPDCNESIIDNRASFYAKDSLNRILMAPDVDNTYKLAAGGYLSTTTDMVKFGIHLLNPRIINKNTFLELTKSQKTTEGTSTNYGIGWMSGQLSNGMTYLGHSGTSVGGKALLIIVPDKRLVFALAANLGEIDFGDEYEKVFEIVNILIKN